jgi:hypothetical protein
MEIAFWVAAAVACCAICAWASRRRWDGQGERHAQPLRPEREIIQKGRAGCSLSRSMSRCPWSCDVRGARPPRWDDGRHILLVLIVPIANRWFTHRVR